MKRTIAFLAYVATIIAANWAINRYGVVPIGFGLTAPAGVYFAGLAFTLRDLIHEWGGVRYVIVAILTGSLVSYLVSDGSIPGGVLPIAAASALSFAASELTDLAVYTPLRERGFLKAVIASNAGGLVVDSALFLWLAFGSLDYLAGQIVGKAYMTALAVLILAVVRWGRARAVHGEPQLREGA
jgi:queuosine precursor transporter